jgi:hypothetical protein
MIKERTWGESLAYLAAKGTYIYAGITLVVVCAFNTITARRTWRRVVKLVQVRLTPPEGSNEGVKEVIRLTHGFHLLGGGGPFPMYKTFEPSQARVSFSQLHSKCLGLGDGSMTDVQRQTARSSNLILDITQHRTLFSQLSKGFELDYGDSVGLQEATKQGREVTLSFERLESVFGKVQGEEVTVKPGGLLGWLW